MHVVAVHAHLLYSPCMTKGLFNTSRDPNLASRDWMKLSRNSGSEIEMVTDRLARILVVTCDDNKQSQFFLVVLYEYRRYDRPLYIFDRLN